MKLRPLLMTALATFFVAGVRRISSFSPSRFAKGAVASAGSITSSNVVRRRHRPSSMCTSTGLLRESKNGNNPDYAGDGEKSSPSLEYTPISSIAPIVDDARRTHASRVAHPYEFRMEQLRGIERLLAENEEELAEATANDLGQGRMYFKFWEQGNAQNHVRYAQSRLKGWMAPTRVPTPFPINLSLPIRSEVTPIPRGVALVITPWNMPMPMVVNSLVAALSAGNAVVLKMSEKSVHTTKLLTRLLTGGRYVDRRAVRVVNGGAEVATELLDQRFDVIMYTGGGGVGRIVAKAAARNLTPALLELGGKNPVFVTKNAHIPSAALRIAWGKIAGNAGQLCVGPDYVLVEESVKEEFLNELRGAMDRMYPVSTYSDGGGDYGDVGRMISVEHAERVVELLDSSCDVIYGGKHHDVEERFVAPTIVEATADSTIMKEEIFGPLLAVVTVPDVEGGIRFVDEHFTSKGEHPLALYIFSKSHEEVRRIQDAVPSGQCAINDVIKMTANHQLPFGGVGSSGTGAYHGRVGFDFFSHRRGSLATRNYGIPGWDPIAWLTYAPYDGRKLLAMRALGMVSLALDRSRRAFDAVVPAAKVVVPIGFAMACALNPNFLDAVLELNLKTILKWISRGVMNG